MTLLDSANFIYNLQPFFGASDSLIISVGVIYNDKLENPQVDIVLECRTIDEFMNLGWGRIKLTIDNVDEMKYCCIANISNRVVSDGIVVLEIFNKKCLVLRNTGTEIETAEDLKYSNMYFVGDSVSLSVIND